MFIVRLFCEHCNFSTKDFVPGYSIQSDAYTCVYRSLDTHTIRIVEVTKDELEQRHIDDNSADFNDVLEQSFALENEREIRFSLWCDDERLDTPCPQCETPYLLKHICGIE